MPNTLNVISTNKIHNYVKSIDPLTSEVKGYGYT